jgi:hypothetical protein
MTECLLMADIAAIVAHDTLSDSEPRNKAASVAKLFAPCQALGREVSKQDAVQMGLLTPDEPPFPASRLAARQRRAGPVRASRRAVPLTFETPFVSPPLAAVLQKPTALPGEQIGAKRFPMCVVLRHSGLRDRTLIWTLENVFRFDRSPRALWRRHRAFGLVLELRLRLDGPGPGGSVHANFGYRGAVRRVGWLRGITAGSFRAPRCPLYRTKRGRPRYRFWAAGEHLRDE